jgi:hypothetical protein
MIYFLLMSSRAKLTYIPPYKDTAVIRVPTRQIREFYTFNVSSALRNSPSARCGIAANEICRFFYIFGKKLSPLRTRSGY